MMKIINVFWLFYLLSFTGVYGQGLAGINTGKTALSQQLHVRGTAGSTQIDTSGIYTVTPTIRIEGLNQATNIVNNSSFGAYALPALLTSAAAGYTGVPYKWSASPLVVPVSVTNEGDMLLSRDYVIPLVATKLGVDEFTKVPLVVPSYASTSFSANVKLKGYTFELRQTCMVHFLASVSVSVYTAGGQAAGTRLTDGVVRSYRAYFKFATAPIQPTSSIITNQNFGTDGNTYTNGNSGTIAGNMYVQPEAYLVLRPGIYAVELWGYGFGYNNPFDVVYGDGPADMVSIIATPLN